LAEYINSQLKGGSNAFEGESIDIYKFRFDGFFSAGPSTFQPPSYQESCSNAGLIQPDVRSQASYEDQTFEDAEIDGTDVEIKSFTNNNNGGTGGAWVAPVRSTAFRGAKISGKVKIISHCHNGNSNVRQ
jgi:hypothetical protein